MMKEKNTDKRVQEISGTLPEKPDEREGNIDNQITQLIRENEALRRTEGDYRILMDTLQEGVWAIDQEGYTTFVNPRMADMLGYSVDEMRGKHLFDFMDDRGKEIAAWNMERRKQGIKEQHEFEFIKKDGERIQALLETGPITDEHGNYRGAIAGVADITGRKKMERDLVEAKKVWEAIFRGIGHPAVILDAHNTVIDANEAAINAIGKSLEELRKMKCWQIFHGKHISGPIQNCPFERMKRSSIYEASELYLESFGGYYLVSTTPIFDSSGNLEKVIHVAVDITERKKAEEKNKQLAAIVESSDDAIIAKTLDGVITSWNAGAEKTYGYLAQEIIGKPITTLIPPNQGNELQEIMEKLRRGEHIEHYETARIRKDKKQIQISLTISPILDNEGKIIGASTIARDITEHKKAEEALQFTRHSIDNVTDTIVTVDKYGHFADVNDAFCSNSGYTRDELLSMTVFDIDPDYSPETWPAFWNKLKQSGSLTFETTHRSKDGRAYPVEITANYFEYNGNEYHSALARDITERKQAEDRIRWLASFPKLNPNSVIEMDAQGTVTFANAATRKILRDLGLPENPNAFVPEDKDEILRLLQEGTEPQIYREITLNKETFAENIILNQKLQVVRIYSRNITVRKKAEEERERNAQEIQDLYNNAPCGYHSLDKDSTIIKINNTELSWLGYSREEVIGRKKITDILTEKSLAVFRKNYQAFKKNGEIHDVEFEMIKKDGTIIPVLLNATAIKDHDGNFVMSRSTMFDITDRKKAENSLKEAEEKYRNIFENSIEGIYQITTQGRFKTANPAMAHMLGYVSVDDLVTTVQNTDHQVWVDQKRRIEYVRQLKEKGSVRAFECEFFRKDTSRIWVSLNTLAIHGPDGNIIGSEGFAYDITERKKAEEKNRQLAVIVESSDDAIIAKTLDGIITSWNAGAEKTYGYMAQEIIGKPITTLVPPDRGNELPEILEKLRQGEHIEHYETTRMRKDKKQIQISLTISPILDNEGTIIGASTIARDITEQKNVVESLYKSEEKFRTFADYTYDWEYWVLPDNTILYTSPSCERITGYTPDEFYKNPELTDEIIIPEDMDARARHMNQIFISTEPASVDYRIRHRNGEVRWIAHICQPVYNKKKELIGRRSSNRDITDRKKTEDSLKEAEKKYRNIFENSIEGIYQITREGRFKTANPAMAHMLGYVSVDDLVITVQNTAHQLWEDQKRRIEYVRQLKEKGSVRAFECEFFRKDKSRIWVSLNTRAIYGPDGNIISSEGFAFDITERKIVENALKESEEMFRNPVEHSPVGIYLIQDNIIRYATRKLRKSSAIPVTNC